MNYFDFAVCFPDLIESGQIEEIPAPEGGDKLYAVTESGVETLESYEGSLFSVIKERALRSALRLIAFYRSGSRVKSSITECGEGFILSCSISDNQKTLFSTEVYLTDRTYAEKLRLNFEERAETIYKGALSLLSGDVNYIFED